MIADLMSLSDNSNMSATLVLGSIDCFFSFCLGSSFILDMMDDLLLKLNIWGINIIPHKYNENVYLL